MDDNKIYDVFMNVGIDLHLINMADSQMTDICDSLQYISLICDIEDAYEIEIPIEMISIPENKFVADFLLELQSMLDNKQGLA